MEYIMYDGILKKEIIQDYTLGKCTYCGKSCHELTYCHYQCMNNEIEKVKQHVRKAALKLQISVEERNEEE
jgi:hypothetical protein